MDRALESRLSELERQHDAGRKTRTIWRGDGEADIEVVIAAMVAAGAAKPDDRFVSIGWRASGPETPMAGALDPFSAAPTAAPPPVPWAPGGVPLQVPDAQPLTSNDNAFWGPRPDEPPDDWH